MENLKVELFNSWEAITPLLEKAEELMVQNGDTTNLQQCIDAHIQACTSLLTKLRGQKKAT